MEEYELLFSCWASCGWGHIRTHTPPGATAKTVHHFYFNKDPPSFINATDAGAMAFKNECASVRSAGASLLRGSAKKGASAARALATGAKVKTTAVKDEEQPQQQQVQQQQLQQQAAVQQATLQLLQCHRLGTSHAEMDLSLLGNCMDGIRESNLGFCNANPMFCQL